MMAIRGTYSRFYRFIIIIFGLIGFQGCSQEQKVSPNAETKQAEDVFGHWITTQYVFNDRALTSMKDALNDTYSTIVRQKYEQHETLLAPLNHIIEAIFATEIKNKQL